MRKGILELLLDDVYVTKEFSLERSRVLLEQTKIDRLSGAAGLGRCMDCLSDAILLLVRFFSACNFFEISKAILELIEVNLSTWKRNFAGIVLID
jgi:hypothetical protein